MDLIGKSKRILVDIPRDIVIFDVLRSPQKIKKSEITKSKKDNEYMIYETHVRYSVPRRLGDFG